MPSSPSPQTSPRSPEAAIKPLMVMAFVTSLSTGLFWHGIAFVSKHSFHFTEVRSEALYMVMGAFNSLFAFGAGVISRRAAKFVSPRAQARWLVGGFCVSGFLPFAVRSEWALWVAGAGASFVAALFWPLFESYLTGGRSPNDARRAVGHFNVVWMGSVTVSIVLLGKALEQWGLVVFALLGLLTLPALPWVSRLPEAPAVERHHEDAGAPPTYRALLRAIRLFLPMSYLLMAAMSPLLPYRLEALGLGLSWATAATAIWLVARVVAVSMMRSSEAWHGRWLTVVVSAAFMFAGVTAVLLTPNIAGLLVGFVVFGLGVGAVYHQALYYALRVGSSNVDAGAVHEGLIGLGYTLGPALALVCSLTAGTQALAGTLGVVIGAGLLWTAKLAWANRTTSVAPPLKG